MSKNICRPIIISNRSIPPRDLEKKDNIGNNEKNEQNFVFRACALGSHDRITVARPISLTNITDLPTVWNETFIDNKVEDSRGNYTHQTIFAFKTITNNTANADENFWRDVDKYPYLFISILQVFHEGELVIWSREFENLIKEKTEANKQYSLITYESLDNTNIILIIKSQDYEETAKFINQLHMTDGFLAEAEFKLGNSYSTVGINDIFLKDENEAIKKMSFFDCFNEEISFEDKYNNKLIKELRLDAVERFPGSVKLLYAKIRHFLDGKRYPKEASNLLPVIGSMDNSIYIRNLKWIDFFQLYQYQKGILHYKEPNFYKLVMGMSTHIMVDETTPKGVATMAQRESEEEIDVKINKFFSEFCVLEKTINLDELYSRIKDYRAKSPSDIRLQVYYKTVQHIILSLMKFRRNKKSDYIYFTIYKPLTTFIECIADYQCDIKEDAVMLFIHSIERISQNSIHADRQAVYNADFDARFYEAPIKLNTFYYVYVNKIVALLSSGSGRDNRYNFLVCPSLGTQMQVTTLIEQEARKLFCVEIPERQIFDIKNILIMLGHEIAHYVGRSLRQRGKRHKYICSIMAKYIANSIVGNIADKDQAYIIIEPLIYEKLDIDFSNYGLYKDDITTDKALAVINQCVYNVLNDVFESRLEMIDRLNNHDIYDITVSSIKRTILDLCNSKSENSYIRFLKALFMVIREIHADTIAISILDISYKDYLEALAANIFKERIDYPFCVFRVAAVINAIEQQKEERWFFTDDITDTRQKQFNKQLEYYKEKVFYIEGNISKKDPSILLFHKQYLDEVVDYIKICLSEFDKLYKDKNNDVSKELKCIRDLYSDVTCCTKAFNIEMIISDITNHIEEYRDNINE